VQTGCRTRAIDLRRNKFYGIDLIWPHLRLEHYYRNVLYTVSSISITESYISNSPSNDNRIHRARITFLFRDRQCSWGRGSNSSLLETKRNGLVVEIVLTQSAGTGEDAGLDLSPLSAGG
jgi:hypothetical protein